MHSLLIKFLYALFGWFILVPVVAYAVITGSDTLPKLFYTYDNEEDGYHGGKRGWYSNYLGRDIRTLSKFKQWWLAYKWCAFRNPCWNLRYHPWASIDVTNIDLKFKGNTREHDFDFINEKMWYDCSINGKYKSHFRAIPRKNGTHWYIRWGWKIYPVMYKTNPYNIWPYKDRSVWAISIRIRGAKR